MGVQNFIPTLWSDLTLDKYTERAVFRSLLNTSYEGEIKTKGDEVKINSIGDVETSAYSGTVTYTEFDDYSRTLKIDQDYYVAKEIPDLDKVQMTPKLMGDWTGKIADAFLRNVEAFIAAKYSEAGITSGSTTSVTSITTANVISKIADIGTSLDEADAPDTGRVAIVPPWLAKKMSLAGILRDTSNSAILSSGYLGEFQGFKVYKSNRITHSSTTWYAPMFFIANDTIAFAEQLMDFESMRLEGKFSDGVRGRIVYGGKVLRPESLAVLYCAEGAESAI